MNILSLTRQNAVVAGIAAIAILVGGGWWLGHGKSPNGTLQMQGNVEVRQVNLGFKVAGRIKSLNVDEGATVANGQVLAALDKVYFEDNLKQARAQRDQVAANVAKMEAGNRPEEIAQAEANVAEREAAVLNAKISLDRAEMLLKTSSGTRKTYDDAQAAYRQSNAQLNSMRAALKLMKLGFRKEDVDAAKAQLASMDAAVQMSERQLADADLLAPGPGVVLSRVREAGSIVNAGETAFVLSLTKPVWLRTYVSEPDLSRIVPGMPVTINLDTPGSKPLPGRVGFIATTAEFTPKTVETRELRTALVYRIRIVADDPDGVLRQGMPVTITIVPADAVKVSGSGR